MFILIMRRVGVRGLRVILGLSIVFWKIRCRFKRRIRTVGFRIGLGDVYENDFGSLATGGSYRKPQESVREKERFDQYYLTSMDGS